MADPLIKTRAGRARMVHHLVRDHRAQADWATLEDLVGDPVLVSLWWLHGHEAEDTDVHPCPLKAKS